jgi:hypothetical protein
MRTRNNPNDNPVTHALLSRALDPIVAWCQEERGRKSQLLLAMQAAAEPETIHRSILESWLKEKPEDRNQPSLAAGMLLLQVAETLGILTIAEVFKRQ